MTRRIILCSSLAVFAFATASAQTPAPPAQAVALENAALAIKAYDPLVTPRPADEITADIETASKAENRARTQEEWIAASAEVEATKVDVLKRDRDAISERIELAKKNGQDAERAALEGQKKTLELQIKVLERSREMKKTHAEVGRKKIEEAQARKSMFELERDLALKRAELEQAKPSDAAAINAEAIARLTKLQGEASELERRVLQSMRDRADKVVSAAQAEKSYVERQLDLFKAQAEALAVR